MPFRIAAAIAGIAGCLAPLSLAPYDYWPLGLLSLTLLALVCSGLSARQTLLCSFCFGLGLYGVGASWVYVSINQFGSTSVVLSLFLTAIFVAGLALAFSLPFYIYGRWFNKTSLGLIGGFPVLWMLGEWVRSWFLTGFPWLYVGYGHLQTPLAGWAPITGVFGVSLAVAATSSYLAYAILLRGKWRNRTFAAATAGVFCLWLSGAYLHTVNWTRLSNTPITLGMVQGNIPQEKKWDADYLPETFRIFNGLSENLWQYDWVIWPEAAIPLLYHRALEPIKTLDARAKNTNTTFITGILYDQLAGNKFFNSIIAVGQGSGISYKMRLVPFGEYVPLELWLRGLIKLFDLPTSFIHPGPSYTNGLQTPQGEIAPSICYEVVYPDLVAKRALTANILLTISNDAWFGESIGPIQHFQMAQMRALETGRYMVRSTNNGLSGIIDPKGNAVKRGKRFEREAIIGEVYAAHGRTPFMIFASWPTVLFACLLLLVLFRKQHD